MKSSPISVWLDEDIRAVLSDSKKHTTLKPAELIRRTLRGYLHRVVAQESGRPCRVTNVEPLPRGVMAKVYKEIAKEGWDRVEAAAAAAQPAPSFAD